MLEGVSARELFVVCEYNVSCAKGGREQLVTCECESVVWGVLREWELCGLLGCNCRRMPVATLSSEGQTWSIIIISMLRLRR